MIYAVPKGLMQRLVFTDETVSETEVPPRISPDLPVIFPPEEFGTTG